MHRDAFLYYLLTPPLGGGGLKNSRHQSRTIPGTTTSSDSYMTGIAIAIIAPGFVIGSCAIGNGMGYVLAGAAQFETVAITIGPISIVGCGATGDGNSGRLSVQIPAIIGVVVGYAALELVAGAA